MIVGGVLPGGGESEDSLIDIKFLEVVWGFLKKTNKYQVLECSIEVVNTETWLEKSYDVFVKWVVKNNNENNGDRHKIHEISWLPYPSKVPVKRTEHFTEQDWTFVGVCACHREEQTCFCLLFVSVIYITLNNFRILPFILDFISWSRYIFYISLLY